MSTNFSIEPSTKVAALLDHYPELEDVLIGIAPPFKKLKNPFLRKSVAKVASLRQAAAVGGVSLPDLINTLRSAVGQDPITTDESGDRESYFESQPEWFDESKIRASIDEQSADQTKMPLTVILKEAAQMEEGEIIELTTDFLPAPGIDILKNKGLLVWSMEEETGIVRTYISKPLKPE